MILRFTSTHWSAPFAMLRYGLCAGMLALWAGLPGCHKSSPTASQASRSGADPKFSNRRCGELLESTVDMLQPARLAITADSTTAIGNLNLWLASCVAAAPQAGAESALLKRLLPAEVFADAAKERFLERDGRHVRDCVWCKRTLRIVRGDADTDLDRVVNLFNYVIRNVALLDGETVPMDPFNVFQYGRGSAEDRAWLFAGLLRQLKIDAVILRPQLAAGSQEKADPRNWLLGVILDGEVYLFDTFLGLPLPADHTQPTTPFVRRPSTLKQFLDNADSSLVLDLDAEHRYGLTAAAMKSPRVELIGSGSFWAPRMRILQDALTGERSVVVFDPLDDLESGPGLFSRVAEAGAALWQHDDIAVWTYPDQRLAQSSQLAANQLERLQILSESFFVPVPVTEAGFQALVQTTDGKQQVGLVIQRPKDGLVLQLRDGSQAVFGADDIRKAELSPLLKFGVAQREHLKSRTAQTLGDFETALENYVKIRLWKDLPPAEENVLKLCLERFNANAEKPLSYRELIAVLQKHLQAQYPDIHRMHNKAAEEAVLWTGNCQFERGEYAAAAATFRRFLLQYGESFWAPTARYLSAVSLVMTNHLVEAIEVLKASTASDPQYHGNLLLVRRWETLQNSAPRPKTE